MRKLEVNSSGLEINDTCIIKDGFLSLALPISYSIICLLGLLSNTMSIFVVFLRKRSCSSSMAVYMRHLALSDSLLVLCLPLRVYYRNSEGPFYLCKVVGTFIYVNMYASILFLTLISLDRYLKIIKPLMMLRIHRVSWSHRASYCVWATVILSMSLFFISNNREHPCDRICFHFHNKGVLGGVTNITVVALFGVVYFPFLCFYGQIATKLRAMSLGNQSQKAQKRKRRLILKTFMVPLIFTLCYLPYHLVRVPYILAQMNVIQAVSSKQTLHTLNELTLVLSTFNSCLDSLIYYLLSSTYRRTTLCALKVCCRT